MDVRLPDGRVVKNVPDGTTKEQLLAKVGPIDVQRLFADTQHHRAMEAATASDPLSRDALETSQEGKLPTWLAGAPSASYAERVSATPGMQFATGAAEPFMAAEQFLLNHTPAKDQVNANRQTFAEMQDRGGAGGFNPFKFAGQMLSPANRLIGKLPAATSGAGKIAQGAAIGAVAGAASPVTNASDYWGTKGDQALYGAAGGAAVPAAGALADFLLGKGSRVVMQSAIKPSALETRANVERAITTHLGGNGQSGFNVTPGGMAALRTTGSELNADVMKALEKRSGETVDPLQLAGSVDAVKDRFAGKFYPPEDLAAIDKVKTDFLGNPKIASLGDEGKRLAALIGDREAARISALQDAGRFQTFAAQQENLAHGGGIRALPTPLNEPYTNVGAADTRLSPSAYPAPGQPRIPGRYTANIDRVPEGISAAADAAQVAKTRGVEQAAAEQQLQNWQDSGGGRMPVMLAQQLKQGLHEQLRDKYNVLGSAETEGMKGLARGARKSIEEVAPEVAPLNARAAEIWNALNVAQRRAMVAGNNNPLGLTAALLNHPGPAAAMALDRSTLVRSLAARGMHQANRAIQPVARSKQAALAAALLANEGANE